MIFKLPFVQLYLIFQLITRSLVAAYGIWEKQLSFADLLPAFTAGLVNDFVSLCYILPIVLILGQIVHALGKFSKKLYILLIIGYLLTSFVLSFTAAAELVFWDEFATKFNFIAVDYLIYTNEIIGTIRESMPIVEIITALILLSCFITYFMFKRKLATETLLFKHALTYSLAAIFISALSFKFYDSEKFNLSNNKFSNNKYAHELGKNGPYEFVSAYRNNMLDYNKFYPTTDSRLALFIVRNKLRASNDTKFSEGGVERFVEAQTGNAGVETGTGANAGKSSFKKLNIVLLTVESLSAEFMASFGGQESITPYLDKLSTQGLFFTNLYAAGTRTVRGLEALTLSVPPTPGSSIVRRPNNHNLFTIGSVFKQFNYDVNFIFGGYSYFDNLKNYFEGNGYNNIDRGNLRADEISFSNVWGVADEDILHKSLEIADRSHNAGRPFFSLIMTTSNHRPYTFPEGRIDKASGAGRAAAVKYTDYAIGKFIEAAKTKPWFDNTIFVITADHCAGGAGRMNLPLERYHIPLIIYSPKYIQPKVVDMLASQIDIAPTILGLLNASYKSKFFGSDILNSPQNRAFVATYQLLGYIKDDKLLVLAPNSKPKIYDIVKTKSSNGVISFEQKLMDVDLQYYSQLISEAVSFYQTASELYLQGKMQDFEK